MPKTILEDDKCETRWITVEKKTELLSEKLKWQWYLKHF